MYPKKILALGGATVALAVAGTPALAAGTAVTVRVEGLKRTLLAPKVVTPGSGVVRRNRHSCRASSGAGALQAATRGAWSGKWFSGLGFEVFKILGETDQFTTTKSYWELFVDNVAASSGICGVKLHRGEQLLFAAVPDTFAGYPLVLRAPAPATAGKPFTVKVDYVSPKGKLKPLARARVHAAGLSARTNGKGEARLTDKHAGTLTLRADHAGYIRAAPVRVRVAG
jgi:hypothetical protein